MKRFHRIHFTKLVSFVCGPPNPVPVFIHAFAGLLEKMLQTAEVRGEAGNRTSVQRTRAARLPVQSAASDVIG